MIHSYVNCDKCGEECTRKHTIIDIIGKNGPERGPNVLSGATQAVVISKKIDLCEFCTNKLKTWLDFNKS